jgi:hypothetical protein
MPVEGNRASVRAGRDAFRETAAEEGAAADLLALREAHMTQDMGERCALFAREVAHSHLRLRCLNGERRWLHWNKPETFEGAMSIDMRKVKSPDERKAICVDIRLRAKLAREAAMIGVQDAGMEAVNTRVAARFNRDTDLVEIYVQIEAAPRSTLLTWLLAGNEI